MPPNQQGKLNHWNQDSPGLLSPSVAGAFVLAVTIGPQTVSVIVRRRTASLAGQTAAIAATCFKSHGSAQRTVGL